MSSLAASISLDFGDICNLLNQFVNIFNISVILKTALTGNGHPLINISHLMFESPAAKSPFLSAKTEIKLQITLNSVLQVSGVQITVSITQPNFL
jgi:hypothetical protein